MSRQCCPVRFSDFTFVMILILIAMITSKSQNGNYLKTRIKSSRMMEDHVGQWRNLRHYHARYHHSQPTSASPKVTTESVLRPITRTQAPRLKTSIRWPRVSQLVLTQEAKNNSIELDHGHHSLYIGKHHCHHHYIEPLQKHRASSEPAYWNIYFRKVQQ